MTKRVINYLIVLLLSGILVGCDEFGEASLPQDATLYLNTDSVISVTYNEEGLVVSVTAESDNAKDIVESYTDFEDKTCSQVIVELVEKLGEAGHLQEKNQVEVVFDENIGVPEEDFEETIKRQIEETLEENNWEATVKVEAQELVITTSQSEIKGEGESETEITGIIPEGAIEQSDGTYIYIGYMDIMKQIVESEEDAFYTCTLVYDADGNLVSEDGKKLGADFSYFYTEYYPNGMVKAYKRWNDKGNIIKEFTSFHDENEQNGTFVQYNDKTGEMEYRTVEGNPDGSPATSEIWHDENGGEYVLFIYDGSYMVELGANGEIIREAKLIEERYQLDNGACHTHTYDYEKMTKHNVGYWPENNFKMDMITTLETDARIEGYTEQTIDGMYRREEWKDGKKVFEIQDGGYYMGYKVKDTTCFYPNGKTKSFEKYFYADGGRYYVEFDEEGNETYMEITTAYY